MDVNQGPDVVEQLPASGNVMTPPSGSYGDKAATDRLKASLPGVQQPQAPATQALPPASGPPSGRSVPPGSAGLPAGLTRPTSQPDVPVSQPLQMPPQNPVAGAVDEPQKRLLVLQQLAESQQVSEETRQWARTNIQKLVEASVA